MSRRRSAGSTPSQYTFSVWVRLVSGDGSLSLGCYSGGAGTVTSQAVLATGTWQRVSFTGDANPFSNLSLGHGSLQAASGTFQFWGAQLGPGAAAETYVPTVGAPVTTTITTTANVVLSSTLIVGVTGSTPVGNPDTAGVPRTAG